MILPAQQIVDWLAHRFAHDVPQRHLDTAQNRRRLQARMPEVVPRRIHPVPYQLDVERVLPDDEHPRHLLYQTDLRLQIPQPIRVRIARNPFAQSRYPLVRLYLDEQQISPAPIRRFVLHHHRLHIGDFHLAPPSGFGLTPRIVQRFRSLRMESSNFWRISSVV